MGAGDIRGGDVGEALQAAALLGAVSEGEHLLGAADVDFARLGQPELKRHRGRRVQHAVDPLGQLVQASGLQAQAGALDVSRHRGHPAQIGIAIAKRGHQHRA